MDNSEKHSPGSFTFIVNAPVFGAIAFILLLNTIFLFAIYTRLYPFARQYQVQWLCKEWEGSSSDNDGKWKKTKAYNKLRGFTGVRDAYRFCSR